MSRTFRGFLVIVICAGPLVAPAVSGGAELQEQTLKTWDAYLQAANLQMGSRLHGPAPVQKLAKMAIFDSLQVRK